MSFILDALKKSEKERQRSVVPGIADLPVVVHYRRASPWSIALIVGLGLVVVTLAVAWWRTSTPERVALEATSTPPPVRATAVEQQPALAPPSTATATRSLASEATRVAEAASRAAAEDATPTPSPRPTAAPATGVVTSGLTSIMDARLAGLPVAALELELLVFSSNPSRRFVYINSAKYVEGDTLAEGPSVVEITTEGAVLSYRGRTYLLPQD